MHQCLTFNYCYYEIPPASKIAAISDLLSQEMNLVSALATEWYLKINDMHSSLSYYHDELPCCLNVFQNVRASLCSLMSVKSLSKLVYEIHTS